MLWKLPYRNNACSSFTVITSTTDHLVFIINTYRTNEASTNRSLARGGTLDRIELDEFVSGVYPVILQQGEYDSKISTILYVATDASAANEMPSCFLSDLCAALQHGYSLPYRI